jgi:DNA-directed RNA polymerase specialized sigma24 family protein
METLSRSLIAPCLDETNYANAYQKGFKVTLRSVRFLGANAETAEEVAQAAWARGWQCRKQLHCPELVGAWVNAIARNLYRSVIRLEKRFLQLEDFAAPSHLLSTLEADVMIGNCTELESRMLTMYYLEGYSTGEIADKEKLCPTSVRVRLMRIRRRLRERLSNPGHEDIKSNKLQ